MKRAPAILAAVLLLACALQAASFTPSLAGKKLIEYGWDCPNTAYLRLHAREMEQRPFDGVVIQVTKTRAPRMGGSQDNLGWSCFGSERFLPGDYEPAIQDLRAVKLRRFRHNFIQVISMPGRDWFAPDWDTVADNAKILARVAKQGGCDGLMFDPEQYGEQKIWTYAALPEAWRRTHSREEYAARVRERGAEFIRAVNSEFPRVKILSLFGPALSLNGSSYDLLAPFMEGMCRAADRGTQIIDGYEQSYPLKDPASFVAARETMRVRSRELFEDKAAFDRVMRVGFGLWLDYNSGRRGWLPEHPEKNHFQPDTWGAAVRTAMSQSDGYVWIYTERMNWWTGEHLGPAYEAAQRQVLKDRRATDR